MSSNSLSENVKYECELKTLIPGVELEAYRAEGGGLRKLKASLGYEVRAGL